MGRKEGRKEDRLADMSSRGCNNSMQSFGRGSSPTPSHSSSDRGGDPAENTASDTQPRHVGVRGLVYVPPARKLVYGPQQAATRPKLPRNMIPRGKNTCNVIPPSFCKTLTASDVNNGAGFFVPIKWTRTLFPPLDYTLERPVLPIFLKDDVGKRWRVDYIYRGGRKTYVLQNGWATFVDSHLLVAGDKIEFSKTSSGELCVQIKRSEGKSIMDSSGRSSHENHGPAVGLSAPTAASSRRESITGSSTKSFQENHGPIVGLPAPTAASRRRKSSTGSSGKSSQEGHGQPSGVILPTEASSNSALTTSFCVSRAILQQYLLLSKDLDLACFDSNIDSKKKNHLQHDLQGSRLDGDRIRENADSFTQSSYSNRKSHHQHDLQGDMLDDGIRENPGSSSQSTHSSRKCHHQHDSQGDRLDEDKIREGPDPSSQSSYCIVFRQSETVEHTVDLSQFSSDDDLDERVAMMFGQESETVEHAVDLSQFSSYDDLRERLAMVFGLEVISTNIVAYRDIGNILRTVGSEPYAVFADSVRRIKILSSSNASRERQEVSSSFSSVGDASLKRKIEVKCAPG